MIQPSQRVFSKEGNLQIDPVILFYSCTCGFWLNGKLCENAWINQKYNFPVLQNYCPCSLWMCTRFSFLILKVIHWFHFCRCLHPKMQEKVKNLSRNKNKLDISNVKPNSPRKCTTLVINQTNHATAPSASDFHYPSPFQLLINSGSGGMIILLSQHSSFLTWARRQRTRAAVWILVLMLTWQKFLNKLIFIQLKHTGASKGSVVVCFVNMWLLNASVH